MRIEDITDMLPPNGLFRTGQILSGQRSVADVRRQLDRWVKSGRVLRLRRGVYALSRPYAHIQPHPFAVACVLRKASYVSLQSALSHHGMIPEDVPVVTSVTTGRPEELATPIGRFHFRHVATSRFFGFSEAEVSRDQYALLATPEKALVDLLYLTPHSNDQNYLAELRLEKVAAIDLSALRLSADRMRSKKVQRAIERIIAMWRREETA